MKFKNKKIRSDHKSKRNPTQNLTKVISGMILSSSLFFSSAATARSPEFLSNPQDRMSELEQVTGRNDDSAFFSGRNSDLPSFSYSDGSTSCSLDVERGILTVSEGGQTSSAEVSVPRNLRMSGGEYLGMICGEGRTILISETKIVVTLGTDHVQSGDETLPGWPANTITINHSRSLQSEPVDFTIGNEGELVYILGESGRLSAVSVLGEVHTFESVEVSRHWPDFSASGITLHHFQDSLFLFMSGSETVVELCRFPEPDTNAYSRRFNVRSPSPDSPSFRQEGDSLIVGWSHSGGFPQELVIRSDSSTLDFFLRPGN